MSNIAMHFAQFLTMQEMAQLQVLPNVSEDVRVMRLLAAYHKQGVERNELIAALQGLTKWCDEAKPLLARGGDFENRANQITRWMWELRADLMVGKTHATPLPEMMLKMSVFLVGEEKAKKTADLAVKLQGLPEAPPPPSDAGNGG